MSNLNTTSMTTSLHMFHESHAPGTFVVAQMVSLAIALIALPIYCIFFVIVLKACRKRKQHERKSRRLILALLLGNLACYIVTTALWDVGMTGFCDLEFCDTWARIGAFSYTFSIFSRYCILHMRCEASSLMSGSETMEKLLLKVISLVVTLATACVPFMAILILVKFEGKTYFIEKCCIPGAQDSILWIFLALDASLSSGYIFLYILPVIINARNNELVVQVNEAEASEAGTNISQRSDTREAVKPTAIRNLKLSSAMIISTFICMFGNCLASSFFFTNDESIIPYLHFTAWQFYAGATDILVNATCAMLMTKDLWGTERLEHPNNNKNDNDNDNSNNNYNNNNSNNNNNHNKNKNKKILATNASSSDVSANSPNTYYVAAPVSPPPLSLTPGLFG